MIDPRGPLRCPERASYFGTFRRSASLTVAGKGPVACPTPDSTDLRGSPRCLALAGIHPGALRRLPQRAGRDRAPATGIAAHRRYLRVARVPRGVLSPLRLARAEGFALG